MSKNKTISQAIERSKPKQKKMVSGRVDTNVVESFDAIMKRENIRSCVALQFAIELFVETYNKQTK